MYSTVEDPEEKCNLMMTPKHLFRFFLNFLMFKLLVNLELIFVASVVFCSLDASFSYN